MPQVRLLRLSCCYIFLAFAHLVLLLRTVAAGRDAAAENAAQRAPAAPVDPAALLAATLLTEVASFLTSRGGRASSEAVAAAFNSRINAAQAAPFRAALRQAATLEKEGAASSWVLRAQYRPRPDPAAQRAAV